MNKLTRLAVLLASTSIGTALPIAGWAGTTDTCLDTTLSGWDPSGISDYGDDLFGPSNDISTPNATTFVSGCLTSLDRLDVFTFTGLNPGENIFEIWLETNGIENNVISFDEPGELYVGPGPKFPDTYTTGSGFGGGILQFSFSFVTANESGWGAYTVSLTEAPLAPVPLPATAGLLGLGLAGLGAVGRRKRAKVRG